MNAHSKQIQAGVIIIILIVGFCIGRWSASSVEPLNGSYDYKTEYDSLIKLDKERLFDIETYVSEINKLDSLLLLKQNSIEITRVKRNKRYEKEIILVDNTTVDSSISFLSRRLAKKDSL